MTTGLIWLLRRPRRAALIGEGEELFPKAYALVLEALVERSRGWTAVGARRPPCPWANVPL